MRNNNILHRFDSSSIWIPDPKFVATLAKSNSKKYERTEKDEKLDMFSQYRLDDYPKNYLSLNLINLCTLNS